jgi:hypothetical protein
MSSECTIILARPGLISSNLIGVSLPFTLPKDELPYSPLCSCHQSVKNQKKGLSRTFNIEVHYLDAQNVAIKPFFQK